MDITTGAFQSGRYFWVAGLESGRRFEVRALYDFR
jgi:hypothetical protein